MPKKKKRHLYFGMLVFVSYIGSRHNWFASGLATSKTAFARKMIANADNEYNCGTGYHLAGKAVVYRVDDSTVLGAAKDIKGGAA